MPKSKNAVRSGISPALSLSRRSLKYSLLALPSVLVHHICGLTPVSFRRVVVVGMKPSLRFFACCFDRLHTSSTLIRSPCTPWPAASVAPPGLSWLPFLNSKAMLPLLRRGGLASFRSLDLRHDLTKSRNWSLASLPVWARYQVLRSGPHNELRTS